MELDHEIFAEGKWNGMEFTSEDLQSIADTFNALGENMKVCLKMGHNDEQPMTDGQPALGWVSKVWVAGEKLMAHYTDLPQIVYDAIKKRLYRNVSIEMDVDVSHKGNNYPYVLTGVALLGADIPAVNTLKDLTHYMSRGAAFSVGRHAVFSAIAGQSTKGVTHMELEQAIKKVAELTTTVATFTTETARLTAENADLKAQVAKFGADAAAATAAATNARIAAKRTEVVAILEDGVKSEAITPALRTQYTKMLRIDDDAALDALDVADVKALVPAGKKQFSREHAKQGANEKGDLRPDQQVAKEIAEVQATNATLSFAAAQKIVFDRNPELARAYVQANDKE